VGSFLAVGRWWYCFGAALQLADYAAGVAVDGGETHSLAEGMMSRKLG
jgi:hypothetical protein